MKTGEAELWLKKELTGLYEEAEAANISSLVLEHLTGLSKAHRFSKKDEPLNVHQLHHLTEVHHRLLQYEPVQYAIEEVWFYGLKLFIDASALIPRPETEELVDWIVTDVKASGLDVFSQDVLESDKTTALKILDVGTGSGCIALSLKYAMPKAEVWGCDVSDDALNVARRNGSELNIRVDFVGLNFLDEAQTSQLPTADIIVSNPPYIPLSEKEGLEANVLFYEPHGALFVPDADPLIFYKALLQFAKKRLYEKGTIYAEIHESSFREITHLFESEGYAVEIRKDMQGKDRMVKARQR